MFQPMMRTVAVQVQSLSLQQPHQQQSQKQQQQHPQQQHQQPVLITGQVVFSIRHISTDAVARVVFLMSTNINTSL